MKKLTLQLPTKSTIEKLIHSDKMKIIEQSEMTLKYQDPKEIRQEKHNETQIFKVVLKYQSG